MGVVMQNDGCGHERGEGQEKGVQKGGCKREECRRGGGGEGRGRVVLTSPK